MARALWRSSKEENGTPQKQANREHAVARSCPGLSGWMILRRRRAQERVVQRAVETPDHLSRGVCESRAPPSAITVYFRSALPDSTPAACRDVTHAVGSGKGTSTSFALAHTHT